MDIVFALARDVFARDVSVGCIPMAKLSTAQHFTVF
jgi:hypothetical protein